MHRFRRDAVTTGRLRGERGAIMVMGAVFASFTLLMTAFAIDIGNASQEHRQAQSAADMAALAGAEDITSGDTTAGHVVDVIHDYVAKNYGGVNWNGCVDPAALAVRPDPQDGCISWDADPPATNVVRVRLPTRQVSALFAVIANVTSMAINATAAASVGHPAAAVSQPCALCTLGSTSLAVGSVDLQNGNIAITGGGVYVGASLTCGPHGTITGTGTGVVGTIDSACSGLNPLPTPTSPIADPLGSLPAQPDYSGLSAQPDCASGTAVPGIYANIGSCTLAPGLYVIAGGTIGGNGLTALTAPGVTIFLTCGTPLSPRACAPGEAGGTVNAGGNGSDLITACTPGTTCAAGAVPGLAIWYDRNNAATMVAHGNGQVSIVGTVYGKSVTVDVNGTPAGAAGTCASGFCSQVVVEKAAFSGQGTLNIDYIPSQNVVITTPASIVQLQS